MPKTNQKPKKTAKKTKKNTSKVSFTGLNLNSSRRKIAAIFVLLFALIGSYMLYRSLAYTYPNTNWPLWAPRIRYCESSNNYQAIGATFSSGGKRGRVTGAWQIWGPTWANYKGYAEAKDAPNNIQDEKAYSLFQSRGTSPWSASYSCWKPYGRADSRPQPDPPLYIPGTSGGQTPSSGGGSTSGCSNHPTIKQSSTGGGECVKHLQSHLNNFGYGLAVDGAWGTNTNNAVRDFQSKHGLSVDGVVGPNTWNALHAGSGSSTSACGRNPAPSSGSDRLYADQRLNKGAALRSLDGSHSLHMQGDGNLVLYNQCGTATWATYRPGDFLLMQKDNNLVVYGPGGAVWDAGTTNSGGSFLLVQNDGNLVLYTSAGKAVWDTRTTGK